MSWLVRDRSGVLGTYDSGAVTVHRRKRLPHWDAAHGVQFITFRTDGGRQLSHHAAEVVESVIQYDDNRRYALLVWCVMPDHVHVIVRPTAPIADIVKAWKSVSARRIVKGTLWQADYFDRLIRNSRELADTIDYVMNNPEAAQLDQWNHKGMYPDRIGECI